MSADIYAAAVEYANRGLRVIPIAANSKVPPKDFSVAEYIKRPATVKELHEWFLHHNYNIAALMERSGLLLVDVDLYKQDHYNESLLDDLQTSTHMRARSARGGFHFYFKAESGLDTQSLIAPSVDTKFKGYALLPPSIIDGKPYEWIEKGEPGILPAFIQRKFAEKKDFELPQNESLTLISQIITNGFTPGQHNEQLLKLSRLLAAALNSDSEDFKKKVFYEILQTLDQRDPTPQADAGHFLPTLKSAWNYATQKKVENPQGTHEGLVLNDLADMSVQYGNYKLKYLVDSWLPENAILLMSGPPEAGKTWLLLDMAISLAFGDKSQAGFMGQFSVPNAKTPVLMFQQEDFPGQVWQRLKTIMAHKLKDTHWNFEETVDGWKFDHPAFAPLYLHNNAMLSFNNPESLVKLEQWIVETGAKAVFIDPLYTLGNNDDYFAKLVPHFSKLKELRTKYGVSFVIAHHNRKSGGTGREQVYGSVLLSAVSEGVILLELQDDGRVRLSRSGKFFPGKLSYLIRFDIDTETGRYVVEIDDDIIDGLGKYDGMIVKLLDSRLLSQKEITEELGVPQSTISKSLTRLVKDGTLIKEKRKYTLGVDTNGV